MSKELQLENNHYRTLFYAFLLQMEKNGQQVVIHHDQIRKAQKVCNPKLRADLWQMINNPTAKTFLFESVEPKSVGDTAIQKAFADMWEGIDEKRMDVIGQNGNDGDHYNNVR